MIIAPLILVYLVIGIIFALAFTVKGVRVIDQNSHGTSIVFRIMIMPGSVLLWPYLLFRWIKTGGNS